MCIHVYIYIYIYLYNIVSPENNEYKIGDPPCRGLARCTDADHQFGTIIVFRARYVIYSYNIYIHIYIYIHNIYIYIYICT